MKHLIRSVPSLALAILFSAAGIAAQSGTPVPTPAATPVPKIDQIEEEKKLIQKETELIKARIEYLKAISEASGSNSVTKETSGGKTTFATPEPTPVVEVTALSYEALDEVADKVEQRVRPHIGGYDRLVLFYEPDFLALSRYRIYREQAKVALANYAAFVKALRDSADRGGPKIAGVESGGDNRGGGLITGLSIPSMAGTTIKSVAELISLFRTDRTITESLDTIDKHGAVNAVIAGRMLNSGNGLRVYNPEQFVPEYDVGIGDENSFYNTLAELQAASAFIEYFIDTNKRPAEGRQPGDELSRFYATAKVLKGQFDSLSFAVTPDIFPETPAEKNDATEFRNMVRAEKLDRFMRAATRGTGVLRVRLIASGGSRRESRNLLLGSKMDYSGSAVIEVSLYDADGTMRLSEVIRHHTGFRKFKPRVNVQP